MIPVSPPTEAAPQTREISSGASEVLLCEVRVQYKPSALTVRAANAKDRLVRTACGRLSRFNPSDRQSGRYLGRIVALAAT